MERKNNSLVVLPKAIEKFIYFIRGHKVMSDADLAALYGVPTKALNQAVQRNLGRFPEDFAFILSRTEFESLRSQFVTLKKGRGEHRKFLPRVFTEQGVAMLSSVLNSRRAVHVNIQIMRAFIKMREMISGNQALLEKLELLDKKYMSLDKDVRTMWVAMKTLLLSKTLADHPLGKAI